MSKARDERPEYVVELEVAGVAILTVRSDSAADAVVRAEELVRPVDVTEVHEVKVLRCVKVSEPVANPSTAPSSSSRKRAPKPSGRGRQT